MVDSNAFKASIIFNRNFEQSNENVSPNPLRLKAKNYCSSSDYTQVILRSRIDKDSANILKNIRYLLQNSPNQLILPFSYKIDEINGERTYDNTGNLLIIREYENDTIKDYYPDENNIFVKQIIETNKNTGSTISKVEPTIKDDEVISTNIIIFDSSINNKYTMYQVDELGYIKSITEILEEGKNFKSLFKNSSTFLPERYVETRKNSNNELEMIDCKLDPNLKEIKYITEKDQTIIRYRDNYKTIDVKTVSNETINQ